MAYVEHQTEQLDIPGAERVVIDVLEMSDADHPGWVGVPVPTSYFVRVRYQSQTVFFERVDSLDRAKTRAQSFVENLKNGSI